MTIIRPETLVRSHRAGFRRYWRWKSRNQGGRPQIAADLRVLIRRMSVDNMLWGAPRIHGELLKLGFAVAQSTVAKYMAKQSGPSGQSWNGSRSRLLKHSLGMRAHATRSAIGTGSTVLQSPADCEPWCRFRKLHPIRIMRASAAPEGTPWCGRWPGGCLPTL
jgi:hypothetical protein